MSLEVSRRHLIKTVGSGIVTAGVAGCASQQPVSEQFPDEIKRSAELALVDLDVTNAMEYSHNVSEKYKISRTRVISDTEVDLTATNWISRYRLSASQLADKIGFVPSAEDLQVEEYPSRFVIVTSPKGEVAGETANPLVSMGLDDVFNEVRDRIGAQISDVSVARTEAASILGSEVKIRQYNGSVKYEGNEYEVSSHLGKFEHQDDVVIAAGVYPSLVDLKDEIFRLMKNMMHPVNG